jgi:hypothetical protein
VNALQENDRLILYRYWSQTLADVLAWEWKLFETQYLVGIQFVEAAMRIPDRSGAGHDKQECAKLQTTDGFSNLESLAIERTRMGLAPPREIYEVPNRDRVDWSKFPEWARPIDPEVFQDSGHEG